MNEQETIADIIAEMRGIRVREFQDYADRFDAAYRREKTAIEADALAVGGFVEAAHERERGNFAALREALKAIGGLCAGLMPTWDGAFGRIKDITEAALAVPARNCDVGTAEEQSRRCFAYCNQYICKDCPCNTIGRCTLVWAQMPYEEGGAK